MDLDTLQRKLLEAARATAPDCHVPYAFEKRIMAHLTSPLSLPDPAQLWARMLWRAAAPCVAISLMLGAWQFFGTAPSDGADTLATELEATVLAPLDNPDDTW